MGEDAGSCVSTDLFQKIQRYVVGRQEIVFFRQIIGRLVEFGFQVFLCTYVNQGFHYLVVFGNQSSLVQRRYPFLILRIYIDAERFRLIDQLQVFFGYGKVKERAAVFLRGCDIQAAAFQYLQLLFEIIAAGTSAALRRSARASIGPPSLYELNQW